jgi:hypothetical protein
MRLHELHEHEAELGFAAASSGPLTGTRAVGLHRSEDRVGHRVRRYSGKREIQAELRTEKQPVLAAPLPSPRLLESPVVVDLERSAS